MIVYLEDEAQNRIGYVITTGRSFREGYDIYTGIDIKYYSKILLEIPKEKQLVFINRVNKLVNYKVYFWKKYSGTMKNIKTKTLDKEIIKFLKTFDEFNLKVNIRFLEELTNENF